MILYVDATLETVVNSEEISQAVAALQDELTDRVEVELPEEREETPVIEQELDPVSFEDTSYAIAISEYEQAAYGSTKNYYELLMGDEPGATFSYSAQGEHEFLQEAQEIAAQSKSAEETRNSYVEADLDWKKKHVKENMKMRSLGLWFVMYEKPNLIFH